MYTLESKYLSTIVRQHILTFTYRYIMYNVHQFDSLHIAIDDNFACGWTTVLTTD